MIGCQRGSVWTRQKEQTFSSDLVPYYYNIVDRHVYHRCLLSYYLVMDQTAPTLPRVCHAQALRYLASFFAFYSPLLRQQVILQFYNLDWRSF